MEPLLLPQTPKIGALLDGRLETIQRMDAERGRVAAARELQVAFFTQLIEALRRTVPEDSEDSLLPRSPTRDVYDGLFDRELASMLVANDPLGLVARLGEGGEKEPGGPGGGSAAAAVPTGRAGGGLNETVLTSDAMRRTGASDEIQEMWWNGR
jgi:Rod binding domain-containing protein